MGNPYDQRYSREGWYWGTAPSKACFRVLELLPPDEPRTLLDLGCGEGRNAVFFARNGYRVTALDASPAGIEKTRRLAGEAGVHIDTIVADLTVHRLEDPWDVLFSTGALHYTPPDLRAELFENFRTHTRDGGMHAFSVFVEKPFIEPAPDAEPTAHAWHSGELLSRYRNWEIVECREEIFDCMSSGVPHRHAVNRVIARKPGSS